MTDCVHSTSQFNVCYLFQYRPFYFLFDFRNLTIFPSVECCAIDLVVFFNHSSKCAYSFISHLMHRPNGTVAAGCVNLYAVALDITLHTTPDDKDCFVNDGDIDLSRDWYSESSATDSD